MTNGKRRGWRITGSLDINILLAFAFGVIFLAVMLYFASQFPNPSPFQLRVFIATLALAAGGVGAMLPGPFEIQYKPLIRAGGAAGMFALVYLVQPQIKDVAVTLVRPTNSPEPAAMRYLAAVDAGKIDDAWRQFDEVARGSVVTNLATYEQLYKTSRRHLGSVARRDLAGTNFAENPPGAPLGAYAGLVYRTQMRSGTCIQEMVYLRATQQFEWRVFNHLINPTPIPCPPG